MEYEHAFPMYPFEKDNHPAEIKRKISAKFLTFLTVLGVLETLYLHAHKSMKSSVQIFVFSLIFASVMRMIVNVSGLHLLWYPTERTQKNIDEYKKLAKIFTIFALLVSFGGVIYA